MLNSVPSRTRDPTSISIPIIGKNGVTRRHPAAEQSPPYLVLLTAFFGRDRGAPADEIWAGRGLGVC
jgi:hypothetical protein